MKLAASLALALLASCHIHLDDGCLVVDGTRLDEEHEETLEILAWDDAGLSLSSEVGDVTIRSSEGPARIVATVHETRPHDGRIEYANGRLVVESESGETVALGDVTIWTGGPLPSLNVETGLGDVELAGVQVNGALTLSTGMGDVRVRSSVCTANGALSSGMGDIDVQTFTCADVSASTGMGDVSLRGTTGGVASLSSGMGDVELSDSEFERLEASTGMGDIDAANASYGSANFETGMGSVRAGDERG